MVHEYTRVPIGRDVCKRGNPPDPVTSASCPHIHWGRWCWWSSVHSTPAWNQIRQHCGVWVKCIWAFRLFLFLLFEIQTLNAMQCEWIAFARVTVSRHFTKLFDILRAGCQRLKVVVSRFHQSEEERSLAWEGEAEYKESGPAFILHSSLRGQPRHHIFIWSHHCWYHSHICTHEQSPLSLFPSSCLSLCRWAIEATFQNLNIILAKI